MPKDYSFPGSNPYAGPILFGKGNKAKRELIEAKKALITGEDSKLMSRYLEQRPDLSPETLIISLTGGFNAVSREVDRLNGLEAQKLAAAKAITQTYVDKAMDTNTAWGRLRAQDPAASPPNTQPIDGQVPPAEQTSTGDPNDDWSDWGPMSVVKGAVRTGLNILMTPYEAVEGGFEALYGQMGGEDNNDTSLGEIPGNIVNALSLVQQVKHWSDQGDGWVGLGDEGEQGRLQALTNLHNNTIDANAGKVRAKWNNETQQFEAEALPPQMVKYHEDMWESVADAVLQDDLEQAGFDVGIAQGLRVIGSVAIDPLNLVGAGFISKAKAAEKLAAEASALAVKANKEAGVGKAVQGKYAKELVDDAASKEAAWKQAEAADDAQRAKSTRLSEDLDVNKAARRDQAVADLTAKRGSLLDQTEAMIESLRATADDASRLSAERGAAAGQDIESITQRLQDTEKALREAGDIRGAELHANTRRALQDTRVSWQARMEDRAARTADKVKETAVGSSKATRAGADKAAREALSATFVTSRIKRGQAALDRAERAHGAIAVGKEQKPHPIEGPNTADDVLDAMAEGADVARPVEDVKSLAGADRATIQQAVTRLRRAGSRGNRKQIDAAIDHLNKVSKEVEGRWRVDNRLRADHEIGGLKAEKAAERAALKDASKAQTLADKTAAKADEVRAGIDAGDLPAEGKALDRQIADVEKQLDNVDNTVERLPEIRALKKQLKVLQRASDAEAKAKGKVAAEKHAEYTAAQERLDERLAMLADAYQIDNLAERVRSGDLGQLDELIQSDMGVHRLDGVDYKKLQTYLLGHGSDPIKKLLASMTDPDEIVELSGRAIKPTLAARIAAETDPEKVMDEIVWALGSSSGMTGTVRGGGLRLAAKAFRDGSPSLPGGKAVATGYGASHARVPQAYEYKLADLDELYLGLKDVLSFAFARRGGFAGVKKADRDWIKSHTQKLLEAGDDLPARRAVVVSAFKDMPRYLKESGRLDGASDTVIAEFERRAKRVVRNWEDGKGNADGISSNYWNIEQQLMKAVKVEGFETPDEIKNLAQRLAQMQEEVSFPSAKELRELVIRGTKLEKEGWSVAKVGQWIDLRINQIWRQSVLAFRLAFSIRNIGEMNFRMWLNGDLNDPLTMLAMAMDTRKARKINGLFGTLGKDVKGDVLSDPKYRDISDINDAMGHMAVRHTSAVDTGDIQEVVSYYGGRTYVPSHGRNFDRAYAHNLLNMWSDPIWKDVMLTHSGIGSDRVMRWAMGQGITDPSEALFAFYRNGPGKVHVKRLLSENSEQWSGRAHIDTEAGLRTFLNDNTQVGTWAGQAERYTLGWDRELIEAMQEAGGGTMTAAPLWKAVGKKRSEQKFDGTGLVAWGSSSTAEANAKGMWRRSVDAFFHFSAKMESMAAYSPFTRSRYWHHVELMFDQLAGPDQVKVLATAREVMGKMGPATKTGRLLRRLEKITESPKGTGNISIDELHNIAGRLATEESRDMFYDAMRNKQHWSALRIALPFGAAWADTLHAWSKLMTRSRGAIRAYNLAKVISISKEPKVLESEHVDPIQLSSNPKLRSFLFADPRSGQLVFTVPVVGSLFGILTGNKEMADITMPLASLNVATGGGNPVPGPGPVLTIPFKTFRDQATFEKYTPSWVSEWLDPFPTGDPADTADIVFESMGAAWAKRIIAGLSPQLGDSQLASMNGPICNYLLSSNPDRYTTKVQTSEGETRVIDGAGSDRLAEDAASLSRVTSIYRGVLANVSPGTLMFNWQVQAQDGSHPTQQALMEHYSQLIDESQGNLDQATEQWLDLYGTEAALVLSSNWKANIAPSNTGWKWMQEHPEEADKYRDLFPQFFPGGEWNYAYEAWLSKGDARKSASVEDRTNEYTSTMYFVVKSRLDEKVAAGEVTQTEATARMKGYNEKYGLRYADEMSFTATTANRERILGALKDSSLSQTPGGAAAAKYAAARDAVLKQVAARGDGSLNTAANSDLATLLKSTGERLATEVPEFRLLWQRTFSKELSD